MSSKVSDLVKRVGLVVFIITLVWVWVATHYWLTETPNQTYRIGRDPLWSSLDFLGKEKQLVAFSDELLRAIAAEQGLHLTITGGSANVLMTGLANGSYDGILSSVLPTAAMRDRYAFSDAFYRFGPVLVVPIASQVKDLKELQGKVVGVHSGLSMTLAERHATNLVFVNFDNVFVGLESLLNGSVDAILMEALPAHLYVQSLYSDKLKVVTRPLTNDGLRLVANRTTEGEQLVRLFNKGLERIREDGTYTRLLKKWDIVDPESINLEAPKPVEPKGAKMEGQG